MSRLWRLPAIIVAASAMLGAAPDPSKPAASPPSASFTPPSESAIPNGPFGDMVRLGEQIFTDPSAHAAQFVGNQLRCSNCHLNAGRLANSSPLWAAYVSYPAYRDKNGHVNSFQERLQGCFRYSMNGRPPPLGDTVLVALESYAFFLARGLPVGEPVAGRGYPKLPAPAEPADYARGQAVFTQKCANCHNGDGAGRAIGTTVVFPALWGPGSFNWGAGMASIRNAAEFIRANMPYGQPNTLTVQQSWDVATFMDSQIRPQDPRFTGDVATTRARFQDTPFSMYGRVVNGALLGDPATTPPSGTVPPASNIKSSTN